nr:MAG TPA: hypothetical protein [Caudoviricetes sp.]
MGRRLKGEKAMPIYEVALGIVLTTMVGILL